MGDQPRIYFRLFRDRSANFTGQVRFAERPNNRTSEGQVSDAKGSDGGTPRARVRDTSERSIASEPDKPQLLLPRTEGSTPRP